LNPQRLALPVGRKRWERKKFETAVQQRRKAKEEENEEQMNEEEETKRRKGRKSEVNNTKTCNRNGI
jgi:hypothetical protein